jgi:hypothetical protein
MASTCVNVISVLMPTRSAELKERMESVAACFSDLLPEHKELARIEIEKNAEDLAEATDEFRKYGVLYVDTELNAPKAWLRAFGARFPHDTLVMTWWELGGMFAGFMVRRGDRTLWHAETEEPEMVDAIHQHWFGDKIDGTRPSPLSKNPFTFLLSCMSALGGEEVRRWEVDFDAETLYSTRAATLGEALENAAQELPDFPEGLRLKSATVYFNQPEEGEQ